VLKKAIYYQGSEVYVVCNLGLEGIRAVPEVAGNTDEGLIHCNWALNYDQHALQHAKKDLC